MSNKHFEGVVVLKTCGDLMKVALIFYLLLMPLGLVSQYQVSAQGFCDVSLYAESFEDSSIDTWTLQSTLYNGPLRPYQTAFDDGWFVHTGPTATLFTGPDAALDGDRYVYCEGSGPVPRQAVVSLISPMISLDWRGPVYMSLYVNLYGPTGSLSIFILSEGAETQILDSYQDLPEHFSSTWEALQFNLTEWRGKDIQIIFRATKPGPGMDGDIAIDQLTICGLHMVPTLTEWSTVILFLLLCIWLVTSIKQQSYTTSPIADHG